VPRHREVRAATVALTGAGWRHRGDLGIAGRDAFDPPADGCYHHLYIVVAGSTTHRDHVDLRDFLRASPDEAARYAALKHGLALCKIHHAAYDRNILGVRPDLRVEVRADILREIDGPMLRQGLQEMNGRTLTIPSARSSRPDPASLDERYELFRLAG